MLVKVDNIIPVSLLGTRVPRQDSIRYYYKMVGFDCLILVCHNRDYVEMEGSNQVAFWNFDDIDGERVCYLFPKAPPSWKTHENLIQVTLQTVYRMPTGRPMWFSRNVFSTVGQGC